MMRRLLIGLALLSVALVISLVLAWQSMQRYLHTPMPIGEDYALTVERGATLGRVLDRLAADGISEAGHWLLLDARIDGTAAQTAAQAVAALIAHPAIDNDLPVAPGKRADGSDWLDAPAHAALTGLLGIAQPSIEGWLFPDTYQFARGTQASALLRQMHSQMALRLDRAWQSLAPDSVLDEPYDALILASIVEKETRREDERARIAGVFERRLERAMRLQTDPTVIYGIGADYDGDIRRRDLQADTPYNTYRIDGLPPTPIALPGEASLRAVMDPADGDALFFVATGDADGSHHFSTTLDEHNAAVARYLRKLRGR